MHVRIKKLDISCIKPHRTMLLLSKRGGGKSVLLQDLMFHLRENFDFCLAMCPTVESSNMLKRCMPECCVYDKFMQSKLDALVRIASELSTRGKPRRFLLVLDDVMYDKSICTTQSFRYLMYNGRHCFITCIILSQTITDMPPNIRGQIDYVFAMKESIMQNKIKLHRMYFGIFATFEQFNQVFDRCTQNYEMLVLDQTKPSTELTECVFWYKAKVDHDSFTLGKTIYHVLSEQQKRSEPLTCYEEEVNTNRTSSKNHVTVVKEDEEESDEAR